ncbi:vitamin B12 ABC transporter ATP-binding protein BtuD [Vibrio hibernica]|uniref:vitamin B12 ABC transporter ATP-binding protein BtuD n=1 Tax=Vibrio hibernica TaxID=2587465 RepID=UPI001881DF5F|nr:vitamin B12 ABC transporter ATP-binding protein BtuD [Vibrio hibernica]
MIDIDSISLSPRLMPMSLSIQAGEIVHVIGPNGSGKSTLLEAVSGLLACEGSIRIDGKDIRSQTLASLANQRAYLPQQFQSAFSLSVAHYLSLSIPLSAQASDVAKAMGEITQLLGIANKLERQTRQLSGGEWQRVRLAGMCLQVWPELNPQAKLLILDEPAAPLDVGQQGLLYKLIDLMASKGLAVLMANHDLNRTLHHSDTVVVLKQGILKAQGKTTIIMNAELLSQVFETRIRKVEIEQSAYLLID